MELKNRILPYTALEIQKQMPLCDRESGEWKEGHKKQDIGNAILEMLYELSGDRNARVDSWSFDYRIIPGKRLYKKKELWHAPEWARRIFFNILFDDPKKFAKTKGVGKNSVEIYENQRKFIILTKDFYPIKFDYDGDIFVRRDGILHSIYTGKVINAILAGTLLDKKATGKDHVGEIRRLLASIDNIYQGIEDEDTKYIAHQYIINTMETISE